MGPEGAVSILYNQELSAIEDKAKRNEQRQKRLEEMTYHLKLLEQYQPQDFIDPRNTRPFLIKALNLLANKKQEIPPRKHGNIRL